MANGDGLDFWAKLGGLLTIMIGPPLALVKTSGVSKKVFEENNDQLAKRSADCQKKIHDILEKIERTQGRQTAWIMAIASKVDVKGDDVREL